MISSSTRSCTTNCRICSLWFHRLDNSRAQSSDVSAVPSGDLRYVDVTPLCVHPSRKHPKFETLTQTVLRINRRLRQCPLPGR